MSLNLDRQLREQMQHASAEFPISYFDDELSVLPNCAVPLHWHPEFEFVTADKYPLDFQLGLEHIRLNAGDSIFINGNILHGMRQSAGEDFELMPNIVFQASLIAPESSAVYQKYILPIAGSASLPFVVFHGETGWQGEITRLLQKLYRRMKLRDDCHEMAVQRNLSEIFERLYLHMEELPRHKSSRVQLSAQVRLQQMQAFIHAHYAEDIRLNDIAASANISVSEANRCFKAYMNISPVEALIQHRLSVARALLHETTLPLKEISRLCGFHSESYFHRRYRAAYGVSPGSKRKSGK